MSNKKQKTTGDASGGTSDSDPTLTNVLLKETGITRNLLSFTSVPQTYRLLMTCKELQAGEKDVFDNHQLPMVCNMSGGDGFKLYRAMVGTLNLRWLEWLDTSGVEELKLPESVTDEEMLIMFRASGANPATGQDSTPSWVTLKEVRRLTALENYHVEEVCEEFAVATDDEGLLDMAAFMNCFRAIIAHNGDQSDADSARTFQILMRLFDVFDNNRNRGVDFRELASGLSVLCGGSRDEKVEAAFALFDYNGDGFITLEDMTIYLISVFKVMYETQPGTAERIGMSTDELAAVKGKQAFEDVDLNHDGRLSYDKFQQWYSSTFDDSGGFAFSFSGSAVTQPTVRGGGGGGGGEGGGEGEGEGGKGGGEKGGKRFSKLRTLNLAGCINITGTSLGEVARGCSNLTALNLADCSSRFVGEFPSLETSWSPSRITDASVGEVARRCPNLQTLNLGGCENITDVSLFKVARQCSNLQSLDVMGCIRITDFSLLEVARGCSNLQLLNLTGCSKITDASLSEVGRECLNLQSLNLAGCSHITDASLFEVGRCSNLQSFKPPDSITDFSLLEVARGCSNLQSLDLDGCNRITDTSLFEVAQGCSNLQSLNLTGCGRITDATLFKVARECLNLQSLNLTDCSVTDASVLEVGTGCSNLHSLNLTGCNGITDACKIALRQLNSKLQFFPLLLN